MRRRALGPAFIVAGLLVGALGLSSSSAGADSGNLPAPLGQATNGGVLEDGCAAAPGSWDGFDANGGPDFNGDGKVDFGPVAVKIQSNGRVWVADYRNSGANPGAGRLLSWPSIDAAVNCTQPDRQLDGFKEPEGIEFDATGNMYVTDTGENRVLKFTPAQIASFTVIGAGAKSIAGAGAVVPDRIWGNLFFPRGVAIGPDGKVWVTDDGNNRIVIFDPSGANDQVPLVISGPAICRPKAIAFIGTSMFVADFPQPPAGGQANCESRVVRIDNPVATTNAQPTAVFAANQPIDLTAFDTTLLASSAAYGAGTIYEYANATNGTGQRPAGVVRQSLGQNGVTGTYDLNGPIYGIDTNAANGNPTLVADAGNFRVLRVDMTAAAPTKVNTTTTLTSSKNPSAVGENVTYTVTVAPTSGNVTPTGTVAFEVNGQAAGSQPLVNGVATVTVPGPTAGTFTIKATYSGSDAFNTSSATLQQVVGQATQKINTTTVVTSSKNPSTVGEAVTFTATATQASGTAKPGGTVQFKVDGTNLGAPVALNASGVATSPAVSNLTAGGHTVTATYAESTGFSTSTGTLTQQVTQTDQQKIATTTAVAVSPTPVQAGRNTTFTATVTAASGTAVPTGTVQFQVDGIDVGLPATLTNGTASVSTTSISAGTHTVRATYSGNATFNGSVGVRDFATAIVEADRPTVRVSPATVAQGGQTTVTGENWPSNAAMTITLRSDPVLLANVTSDANGRINRVVTIPGNTEPGAHTILLSNGIQQATAALQVTQATTATTQAPATTKGTIPITGGPVAGKVQIGTALVLAGLALTIATNRRPAPVATRRRR